MKSFNGQLLLQISLMVLLTTSVKAQFAGGSGTVDDPFQIATIEQLQQVRYYESEYSAYRAPALVVSNEGTILAFTEGRIGTWQDDGAMDDIILRRSTDGGKTWGPVIMVATDGINSCKTPVPVVLPSGRIIMIYTWNEFHEDASERDTREIYQTYSDDDGLTWSEPSNITEQIYEEDWGWYGTGPGHGIVKQREPHKGRIIIPSRHNIRGGVRRMTSHIVYSDDDGETWHIGALALRHPKSSNESTAVELSNGDIMLNSRNGTDDEFYRVVSISSDGGETFHTMYLDSLLLDPPAQGTLLKHSLNEETGKYNILFSNPHSGEQGVRVNGTLKLSQDDGVTWSKMIRYSDPYPTFSSYSDIAVINEDGDIGVLFERGAQYMPRELRWDGVAFRIVRFDDINIPITPDFYEENHYENPNWNVFEVEGNDFVFDARSGRHFKLVGDIDASETVGWNDGNGFEPLGDGDGSFSGTFNGNGYAIKHLTINRPNESEVGLFASIGATTIENVVLEDAAISGGDETGGVAGVLYAGEIRNARVSGVISGDHRVGGVVGDNQGGEIWYSHTSTDVNGSRRAGGAVGQNRDGGIVRNSSATGDISTTFGNGHDVGGLVGGNTGGEIHHSFAIGKVYGLGRRVGGLAGQSHDGGVITNSYAKGNVSGDDDDGMIGGLVGRNRQASIIESSYSTGTAEGKESGDVGAFAGLNDQEGVISDSYWDVVTSGMDKGIGEGDLDGVFGLNTAQMSGSASQDNMPGFDFANDWKTTDGYPILYWQDEAEPTNAARENAYDMEVPEIAKLAQNYPNPFNPSTHISYSIPKASEVSLTVYDVMGRQVSVLVSEYKNAGYHQVSFDASHMASGVYIYQLHTNSELITRQMILVK